jgi:hypothetical protein
LFDFRDREHIVPFYQTTELADQSYVFRDITTKSPEFGILFHKALHVGNGFYAIGGCGANFSVFGLIIRDIGSEGGTEITKVGKYVLGVEWVRRGG